jgi:hypothetical protein
MSHRRIDATFAAFAACAAFAAFAVACALALSGCAGPTSSAGDPETSTRLASVDAQTLAALRKQIPPPPDDAILLTPNFPLRNGPWVVRKERYAWLPPGTRLTLKGNTWVVPEGTRLWKDFYYREQGMSSAVLIERRLLVKVPIAAAPDGWMFLTSWRSGGVDLDSRLGTVVLESPRIGAFALDPSQPLPVNDYPSEARISIAGRARYVFPGKRNCTVCHGGAAAFYPQARGSLSSSTSSAAGATSDQGRDPVLAFSLHPAGMNARTREALQQRGWLDVSDAQALTKETTFGPEEPLQHKFVGSLRNNCLSCHNDGPRAPGRLGAFRLDPNKAYGRAELLKLLGVPGAAGARLVDVSAPTASEFLRRLHGDGRAQMPPQEGGVPGVDEELADLFSSWIHTQAGSRAYKPRKGVIECPDGFERLSIGTAGAQVCTDGINLLGPFTKAMRDVCLKEGGGSEACVKETWEFKFGLSIRGEGVCPQGANFDASTGYCVEGTDVFGPFPAWVQQRCVDAVKGGSACLKSRWALAALKASL